MQVLYVFYHSFKYISKPQPKMCKKFSGDIDMKIVRSKNSKPKGSQ